MSETSRRGLFGRIAAATGLAAVVPFIGRARIIPPPEVGPEFQPANGYLWFFGSDAESVIHFRIRDGKWEQYDPMERFK